MKMNIRLFADMFDDLAPYLEKELGVESEKE